MIFEGFSEKQKKVLHWWIPDKVSPRLQGIICDGAVRSGKTVCLSLSFLLWSFTQFSGQQFALCGNTIRSLRRNLVRPLMDNAEDLGYDCKLTTSTNLLEISLGEQTNRFHLFGGKDERSASLIQGITLAGVLFDEVALMPRSFVEQALARCSVEGSTFWFNCNPEHPSHWFYKEWITKAESKKMMYLHFTMADNPSLSPRIIQRYESLYEGAFYQRYVEGKWTATAGAVYPMFDEKVHVVEEIPHGLDRFVVSCDYGTTNPSSFGLWGYSSIEDCWYRIREYYYDSRMEGTAKTDEEYCDELDNLAGDHRIEAVIVDPSAASLIQCIRRRGRFPVLPAINKVLEGIRLVESQLLNRRVKFHKSCTATVEELSLYCWDSSGKKDVPLKKNDHAMDEIRYFVKYAFDAPSNGFYAVATKRK